MAGTKPSHHRGKVVNTCLISLHTFEGLDQLMKSLVLSGKRTCQSSFNTICAFLCRRMDLVTNISWTRSTFFLQKDNFYECVFPARCSTCPDMWSRCGDVTSRLRSTWGSHRWQNSRAWVRSWTCEGTGIPTSIGQGPYIFPWGQGHHPFNFGAVGSLVGAATSLIVYMFIYIYVHVHIHTCTSTHICI